jgi:hypothetical protein
MDDYYLTAQEYFDLTCFQENFDKIDSVNELMKFQKYCENLVNQANRYILFTVALFGQGRFSRC